MEIYVQYYRDATPLETSRTEPVPQPIQTYQHAPTPMSRVRETPATGRTI